MEKNKSWTIVAIILILLSLIFYYVGYDKVTNYKNPENSWADSKNAYVGGDAYNYIINAEYATGNFVIAVGLDIVATLLLGFERLINTLKDSQFKKYTNMEMSEEETLPNL